MVSYKKARRVWSALNYLVVGLLVSYAFSWMEGNIVSLNILIGIVGLTTGQFFMHEVLDEKPRRQQDFGALVVTVCVFTGLITFSLLGRVGYDRNLIFAVTFVVAAIFGLLQRGMGWMIVPTDLPLPTRN